MEEKDNKKKKNQVSFYENFLNAIKDKDLEFIKNNLNKVSFVDYGIQNSFWNEITIFQEIIVNNFVEAFELIIDKYAKEKDFKPHIKEFNYIVINACYFAKHEILKILHEKFNLDLNFHNQDELGLIHLLFEAIHDDILNNNIVPNEDIINTILWLRENGVNTFEKFPLLKTDDQSLTEENTAMSRKTYHSIYSYLIAKDKFSVFNSVLPKGRMFNLLKKQFKFKRSIMYLYRYLSFFKKPLYTEENEGLFSKNIRVEEFLLNDEELTQKRDMDKLQSQYAYFDKNIAEKLLLELIELDPDYILEILFDEENKNSFLFHINDFTFYKSISEKNYIKIVDEIFNSERKNDKMYTPINWLIKKEFLNPVFFEEIYFLINFNENIRSKLINNEDIIDEMLTSFISQKNPPSKNILIKQLELIKCVNSDKFSEKIEYKDNQSNKELVEKKIDEWIEQGFYIEDIEI